MSIALLVLAVICLVLGVGIGTALGTRAYRATLRSLLHDTRTDNHHTPS
jgi:hypothetical protein